MSAVGAQQPLAHPAARTDPWRAFWPALAAIVLGALLIRVAHTVAVAPWPPPGLDDQYFFSALPKLLADGQGFIAPFKFDFQQITEPTAEHPPLYSVVLALPAWLGFDSPDAQRLPGALFGAGTVAAVGVLARRLAGDRAGLIAAGLAAVYPTLIAADGALMSETLYGLLVALSLLAAYHYLDRPDTRSAVVLGALLGLTALTRGEALLLFGLLLVPAIRRPGGWRGAAVAVVVFAAVLTPWTIRNWSAFDRPVLVATNSGTAIAGANCDATFAAGDKLGGWNPPCIQEHPGLNEAEHHAEALREGLDYAGDHLGRLPVVLAARVGRVWSVYEPFQTPEGRNVRVQKLGTAMYWLLIPLAAWGLIALRRRGVSTWILLMPFVVVTVTALATYGNVRFREPAELSLVILAAVALDALWRRREAGRPEPATT